VEEGPQWKVDVKDVGSEPTPGDWPFAIRRLVTISLDFFAEIL
jgi:hypothetical protein